MELRAVDVDFGSSHRSLNRALPYQGKNMNWFGLVLILASMLRVQYSLPLSVFLFSTALLAQTPESSKSGTVLRSPSFGQKISKPSIMMARNAYGSIQRAISSAPPGPSQIYLSCGVYSENIVITSSEIRILGE